MSASSKVFSLVEVRPGQPGPGAGRGGCAQAAPAFEPASVPGLWRGAMLAEEAGLFRIALDHGDTLLAKRAAGCLLRPEPGDTVLVHIPETGQAYVLSVLEKADETAVVDAPGTLRIEAAEGLDLAAPELRLRGRTGRFDFACLDLLAGTLTAKAGRIVAVAASLESRLGDLTQTIRLAVRQVETEVVRAGGIRQFVRERFFVRSGQTTILAKDDVTVDASKIHLG